MNKLTCFCGKALKCVLEGNEDVAIGSYAYHSPSGYVIKCSSFHCPDITGKNETPKLAWKYAKRNLANK